MSSSERSRAIAQRLAGLPPARQKEFIAALRAQGIDFGRLPIVPDPAAVPGAPRPASYAQARQWFLWQMDPESTAQHITAALTLHGALDGAALRASLQALVARHPSLRTRFGVSDDGVPQQTVSPEAVLDLREADLRAHPAQVRGLAGAQQAHAQQRAVRQVEGRAHEARGLVAHLRGVGAQIGFAQVEHRLGRHGLLRHAVVAHAEARAQRRICLLYTSDAVDEL